MFINSGCRFQDQGGIRIGANVTVLPGVTIGDNAVIGARAVVTKDIPDGAVAVRVPAKMIQK